MSWKLFVLACRPRPIFRPVIVDAIAAVIVMPWPLP